MKRLLLVERDGERAGTVFRAARLGADAFFFEELIFRIRLVATVTLHSSAAFLGRPDSAAERAYAQQLTAALEATHVELGLPIEKNMMA